MLSIEDVRDRILAAFPDADVKVNDPRGTSNYFQASIVTPTFSGMPRVKRQRAVMSLFDTELKAGIVHALTFKTYAPEEL